MDDKVIELLVEIKGEVGEVKGLLAAAAGAAVIVNDRINRAADNMGKVEGRVSKLEQSKYWLLGWSAGVAAIFGLVPQLFALLRP
jgi:hypothetical protein